MDSLIQFVNIFLHIDKYLFMLVDLYGVYVYLLLFVTIFLETGVVITPFLPGDSLLFAAGALAASSASLNIWVLFLTIAVAAIFGDSVNYSIGKYIGLKIFKNEDSKIFRKEYLEKTEEFYASHGDKAIVLGRFFPIIRTFVPFIAGIGRMDYGKFLSYNILGGAIWTFIFLFGGYLFGNIGVVKNNFTIVIFGIIIISLLPAVYQFFKKMFV